MGTVKKLTWALVKQERYLVWKIERQEGIIEDDSFSPFTCNIFLRQK
jgi:hypothetical protein